MIVVMTLVAVTASIPNSASSGIKGVTTVSINEPKMPIVIHLRYLIICDYI